MKTFAFTVPGRAVPWMRTNAVKGRKVTPKEQRRFQEKVRQLAALAGVEILTGPVVMDVTTFLTARVAPHKATSGDWDNYGKTVGDALNGVAYRDDCQIVDGHVRKLPPDEKGPRVEVEIKGLDSVEATARPAPSRMKGKSRLSASLFMPMGSR